MINQYIGVAPSRWYNHKNHHLFPKTISFTHLPGGLRFHGMAGEVCEPINLALGRESPPGGPENSNMAKTMAKAIGKNTEIYMWRFFVKKIGGVKHPKMDGLCLFMFVYNGNAVLNRMIWWYICLFFFLEKQILILFEILIFLFVGRNLYIIKSSFFLMRESSNEKRFHVHLRFGEWMRMLMDENVSG